MNKEGTVYTIIFIFIVSVVFVFLLSLTNVATVEQVELNEEVARQSAVLSAMGIDAASPDEVQEKYAGVAADTESGLYAADVDGRTVYASRFAGPGLWGQIEGYLAVDADISRIVGIEISRDNETPGLGGRINESWFKAQFRDEQIGPNGVAVRQFPGEGDSDKENGAVDAVTGATRSSEAIEAIVNSQLDRLRSAESRAILTDLETQGGNS